MSTCLLEAPPANDKQPSPSDLPTAPQLPQPDLDPAVAVFVAQTPRLFRIAHRILADAGEAEDVVQEVWLRWQRADRARVMNPPAFLATATSRIAINVLQSARSRHEVAITPWTPEVVDVADDPETTVERVAGVEVALYVLLERLSPAERAAYVLRQGFDYPYRKIAALLRTNAAHVRQLVRRAQLHIHSPRRRPVNRQAHRRLVGAFVTAAQAGELTGLESLLAADVQGHTP
jgi:RNA polymerase sigma factor (sigma-70 family)